MSYIGKGVETVTFNTATTLDVAGNITLGGTVDGRDVATDGTKLDTITSGAIADILQDTTPQLGGNLDLNTNDVIGTGNINVTGSITGTSFVSTGNMSFTNNSKAIFGTSPSLEIYHDGSNSILDDVGAGNFKMQLAGADKLEITSTGVDVTGTATVDQLIIDSVGAFGSFDGKSTITTESVFAGSDKDFRIKTTSNNVNHFVVQATTGNVGIGTDSPSGKLNLATPASTPCELRLTSNNTGSGAGDRARVVVYSARNDGTAYEAGKIEIDRSSGTEDKAHMIFATNDGSGNTERMRIDSGGNVNIGSAAIPASSGAAGRYFDTYNLGTNATSFAIHRLITNNVAGTGTSSADIYKRKNGEFTIANNETDTAAYMNFQVGTQSRMKITSTGNVGIGTTLIPADASLTVHDDIKINIATSSKQRIYSLSAGTGPYNLGTSGGAAVVFDRLADNSDELVFETHYAGNSHSEKMRISKEGNVKLTSLVNSTGYTEMLRLEGQTLSNGWERGIAFTGNSGGLEVGRISSYLTGAERHLRFTSAGVLAMTIRENGSVGVGTQSPVGESKLTVANGSLSITGADQNFGGGGVRGMLDLASGYLRMGAVNGGGSANGVNIVTPSGGSGILMNSSGNVGIGSTTSLTNKLRVLGDNPTSYTNAQFEIVSNAGNVVQSFHAGGATAVIWKHPRGVNVLEARNNADSGYININAALFVQQSDYRLKENIVPISDATERLKKLNPVRFNFKPFEETGEEHHDNTVDGFLAHEVSHDSDGNPLVPEAVTGEKDGMRDEQYVVTPAVEATYDDDGNILTEAVPAVMGTRSVPNWQGLDASKLVPLLVKTIQELEARIAALENT